MCAASRFHSLITYLLLEALRFMNRRHQLIPIPLGMTTREAQPLAIPGSTQGVSPAPACVWEPTALSALEPEDPAPSLALG